TGPPKQADVVFVHGLMGSAHKTWSHTSEPAAFWPNWLSEYGNIWMLGYPAELFWWLSSGASMALPDRARSVIDFLANHELGHKPLVLVTHSLGGLLVKAILRTAYDLNEPRWKRLLSSTRGIVFLGTPHTGSALATYANAIKGLGIAIDATQL